LALGLLANAVSPRGLKLTRNYFPALPAATNSVAVTVGTTNSFDAVAARLKQAGLQAITSEEAQTLYRDPRYAQSFVVFIDARDDAKYQEGHIPGAWQFDYYRPERHLAAVLPLVQLAHEVVVYCEGGDCEDSQLTAMFLKDNGIPADKLKVYVGGMHEWRAQGFPVEKGERGSGASQG
jgi:rhodanese-related sulfurtransferase